MKLVRLVSTLVGTSVLSLLFGTTALIYAQDPRDEAKTPQQETRPEASKPKQDEPSARQGEAKPAEQSEDKPARGENKPAKQESGQTGQSNQHAQRSADHRGGRIPDDKFRAQFGRQHTFKINRTTTAQGQPGFQYGGYTFAIIDVWPAEWAYTDDCYVDYVDGEYFLFDLLHPGVGVAIVVVL